MWGWDDTAISASQQQIDQEFPQFNLEYVPISYSDYATKLRTAFSTGSDVPDIAWIYRDNRMSFFNTNQFEDLSKPPYNFDINQQFDYLHNGLTGSNGAVYGVEWSLNPTGYAYKRDLCQQYFGTSDNVQLSTILNDWDTFISMGKKINDESNGEVFLLASLNEASQTVYSQNQLPIIENQSINKANVTAIFTQLITMRDANVYDRSIEQGPAYNTAYADKNHIMFLCSTWSPAYNIEPNDASGSGNWGLLVPPGGGFSIGGVCLSIPKNAKNKQDAWDFIKWYLLSEQGGNVIKQADGEYIALKSMYDNNQFVSNKDPFFGGQDIGNTFFNELNTGIAIRPITQYDPIVLDAFNLVSQKLNSDTTFGVDDAVSMFINEVQNKANELTVD